jgi:hypothetical protein
MYRLAKSPDSIIQIFTSLCLSQVKEQLPENLMYFGINPVSFIYDSDLYSFIHNKSIILDESVYEYAVNLNFLNFQGRLN